MEGNLVGVFGSQVELKSRLLSSIAKKSETEGIVVYSRVESGRRFSFLDDATFPEKIQGYARIASICDYAYYIFPNSGKLASADGELAVLIDSLKLDGSVQIVDALGDAFADSVKASFRGLSLSLFPVVERDSKSSVIDMTIVKERKNLPRDKTLVYIDRAFNVKGVGVVVLGFVLSGKISVHDKLRLIPGDSNKLAEVKGIQVSDEDFDTMGRGIRVGLSLKGVELKDLEKTSWLDDGSFELTSRLEFEFRQSPYYKQPTVQRDLHIEVNGEMLVSKIIPGKSPNQRIAELSISVPKWNEMSVGVLDLNSKLLRVAGGGSVL